MNERQHIGVMSVSRAVLLEIHPGDAGTLWRPRRGLAQRLAARGSTWMAEGSRSAPVRVDHVRTRAVTAASVHDLRTIRRERTPTAVLSLGDPPHGSVLVHNPQVGPETIAEHDHQEQARAVARPADRIGPLAAICVMARGTPTYGAKRERPCGVLWIDRDDRPSAPIRDPS